MALSQTKFGQPAAVDGEKKHMDSGLKFHEQNQCFVLKEHLKSDSKGYLNSLAEGLIVIRTGTSELHERERAGNTVDAVE